MLQLQMKACHVFEKAVYVLGIVLVGVLGSVPSAAAQSAETLSKVKKVFVDSFGQEPAAFKLRERVIEQFKEKAKLEIVDAPGEADAIVHGEGSVWITGYISNDLRSPSNSREPILRGYLSIEITGKNGEPLWSYLVTPSKFIVRNITDDLADHLVAKLATALTQKAEGAPASSITEAQGQVTLTAAGATFPAPLYQKWFELFEQLHPNLRVDYSAVGSGAGLDLLLKGKLDFGASDMPLSDEKMAELSRNFLHFASVIGAVVPVYNLKGMDRTLNFTPAILAGIYLGKIRKWNDPPIREVNRNAPLPDADIVVFHRLDGSGTTFVFTDYLSKVSPEWKASVGSGTTVSWPIGTGEERNEGVAAMVQRTPNAIGYVESVYALRHQLSFGAVQNSAGQFIQADIPSITAAAANVATSMTADSRISITNPPGKGVYPMASFTWWLLPANGGSGPKKAALLELLQWVLTSGQKECSELGYAPLPREVASRELRLVDSLR
jgi:phosphate transport system substrate-binding protein